ncbi:MAG: autotransporter outer membrane beta-barrel domain-containing protein [Planctomycetaceae bacterium]|nr:autotransporter outer membrane beta-barrel domain-containing protein [Planctomycetaceae bacterium]
MKLVTLVLLVWSILFALPQKETFAQSNQRDISYGGEVVMSLLFSNDVNAGEQQAIVDAATYWISVIKPTPTSPTVGPAIFVVSKEADLEQNAAAVSLNNPVASQNGTVSGVQSILADRFYINPYTDDDITAHAQILIGTGWVTSDEKSQSGSVDNNLLPVIIHELGHTLGMSSSLAETAVGNGKWGFGSLTRWDTLLRDNNGNKASAQGFIGHGSTTSVFELGDPDAEKNPSHPTFFGTEAMKVFYDGNQTLINAAGKKGGVPVTGYVGVSAVEDDGGEGEEGEETTTTASTANWEIDGGGSLSHLDTWNTLLSWQEFRNFQGLIEVEMAVFKDLGYTNIETRDFFGQSFYLNGDGTHGTLSTQQIANRGFGKWNTNAYDTSTANDGMFGIGLHLFGSNLNILQQGTINTIGAGSAGIRVDGVGNFLTTDADSSKIRIASDNGIGLLVAFGKEHVVVHRGSIWAYANSYVEGSSPLAIENGIAASFDFGKQLAVSDEDIANGGMTSYLRSYYYDPDTRELLSATNGPLVRRFDVTGELYGSRASIYIGKTAHVDQINIMRNAKIAGNIMSYYTSGNRGTSLTFGLLPDASGQAQSAADTGFNFVLSDHINYDTSLLVPTGGYFDISVVGGVTNFSSVRVHSRTFNIGKDATLLLGKSSSLMSLPYSRVSSSNSISNDGVLAGSGEIRIGLWDFDGLNEEDSSEFTEADVGWSNRKIAFWRYSIPGKVGIEELYFSSSDRLINRGVISPGVVGDVAGDGNTGQFTVGQIDIHGGLVFTDGSTYDLTFGSIPKDQSIAQWAIDNDAIWVDGATTMRGKLRVFFTDNFTKDLQELRESENDDPITYQIIRSTSFTDSKLHKFSEFEVGGGSGDVKISGVYVNPFDSTVAQITLFPNPHYFEEKGDTWNTRSVGRAIDNVTWELPEIAFSLLGAKDDPATMHDVLHQIATDVRANSIMAGVLNPSRFLFPRIGWGNGQMASGERGRIDWRINRERSVLNQFSEFRGQVPQQLRNGSVWFDYIGQSIASPSDGNSSSYRTHLNGGILGGEWNLTQHSALGLVLGYGNGATNSGRNKVRVNDYFAGMYFVATPYNQYEFKAYVGLGRQEYTLNHTIYNNTLKDSNTGQIIGIFDNYYGRTDGTTISMSYELTRPIMITERFILRPTFGVDSQHAWQSGFTEEALSTTSNGLYTLSFDSMYLNHNMLRVGLNSESISERGSLWLRGFYNLNFGGSAFPTSRVRFTQGGGKFDIRGADIGWDAVNFGVGFHLWMNVDHSASFIFDFNTDLFIGNSGASSHGLRVGIMHNF